VRILVVDDDRPVRESLRRSLSFNGYEVELAGDGLEALQSVADQRPDAVVLDVMMPRMDGLETCRRLRAAGDDIPVLMLTAREMVSDRVAGLDAGADDYLAKPFALEELLARLRALLRRVHGTDDLKGEVLSFADLSMDLGTREVSRGSRARILEEVWGYDFPTTENSLEVYVGYLRRKTEAEGEPRLIHTVRGVGYALRETPP
jgi:two-component system response regulator MprA